MQAIDRRALLAAIATAAASVLLPTDAAAATQSERTRVRGMVQNEATVMRFAVPLALAVAHAESYFDPRAESSKGARGVMQIMPATARGEYGLHPDLLWDPRLNARVGIHFLGRLIVRYRGRTDLALSYYNGGSAVGDLPSARVLPATRDYVNKVLGLERAYARTLWG